MFFRRTAAGTFFRRTAAGTKDAASAEAAEKSALPRRGVLAGRASSADSAKETFSFCEKKKVSLDSEKEKGPNDASLCWSVP
ncbi:MAG: hypothetical protein LBM18_03920, partial [Oscillospiraceae bacterium]|nr:hypothetical protein [Oscillospiraceae bacterium]